MASPGERRCRPGSRSRLSLPVLAVIRSGAGMLRRRHGAPHYASRHTILPNSGRCGRAYLCTYRNTHSRSLDIADGRRAAFSVILVGNQIAEYSRLSGLAETLWIFRHIFQFCASRPPSPQAALRPAGIQSWQPRRAVTTCLAVSMVRICCSPTLVRLPGSSSACGALPAQGKVLGAPDVIDERRSGLEGERAADGAGQCWGCPGREAELVGDAAAGEGVVAKAGVPRCPAQLTLELLRAGLA